MQLLWNMFQVDIRSRSCKKVKIKFIFGWFQVESHAVRSTYDEHSVKSNYNNEVMLYIYIFIKA